MTSFNYTDPLKPTIAKSPVAVLDYSWNFTEWLAGDTIASFLITPDTGITKQAETQVGGVITAFLSGGVIGKTYRVTCKITTTNATPRIDERSIYLTVVQR